MRRALVTGAGGFIARHLIRQLEIAGWDIWSLGRPRATRHQHVELTNLTDDKAIQRALTTVQPDTIFHLAGSLSALSVRETYVVNTMFGAVLLDCLRATGMHDCRIILLGSAAEIGRPSELPAREDIQCLPETTYGIAKYAQLLHARAAATLGQNVTMARLFNVAGQGMSADTALPAFARQIVLCRRHGGEQIKVGNLATRRDIADVIGVAEALAALADSDDASGQLVNICTGQSLAIGDLLHEMIALSGLSIKIVIDDSRTRAFDVAEMYGDPSKLVSLIGFAPPPIGRETLAALLAEAEQRLSGN